MTDKELCEIAVAFSNVPNFYELGGWGQEMTRATLESLAERYPKNKPVNYDNVGKWGFDCICWIKGMLAGVRPPDKHINSYTAYKTACPIGDCTNVEFKKMLYDCCEPASAPAGYGLASDRHAALSLGSGRWIDCNREAGQDGIKIHTGAPTWAERAGKIPGVEYGQDPQDEREILMRFVTWLVDEYLKA